MALLLTFVILSFANLALFMFVKIPIFIFIKSVEKLTSFQLSTFLVIFWVSDSIARKLYALLEENLLSVNKHFARVAN